jgi:hypothetical protein
VDDDAEARARARAAVLAVVGAAPAPSTQEPSRRRAQAAIAALAVATVAAGVVAIVARRGDAPDTARPPSPPATARVETLASLRGLLGAPRAPRLPGWLQPAYRDASGGDAPAGPARLLVTAAGPDREAIYAWPTRSGGLALAGGDALGTDRPAPVPAGALLGLGRRPPDAVRDRRAAGGHRPLVYGLVTDDVAAVAIRVSGGRSTGRHSRTMPSRTSCRTRRRQARPTPSG